eukprot:303620-Prymnesium_polylepis.1
MCSVVKRSGYGEGAIAASPVAFCPTHLRFYAPHVHCQHLVSIAAFRIDRCVRFEAAHQLAAFMCCSALLQASAGCPTTSSRRASQFWCHQCCHDRFQLYDGRFHCVVSITDELTRMRSQGLGAVLGGCANA